MKMNKKILIIVAVAAVLLVGLMMLLIFMPKGDSNGDGKATYDEGVAMVVSTDKKGVHQAQIKTNDKGEIDNNSYGTLMEYVPRDISTIHVENSNGTLDVISYTPKNDNGKTEATQYKIKGFDDLDLQVGVPDAIANAAATITFTKVMTLDKNKSAEFGFDKPRATVTTTYSDKTKTVIYVGNDAPQNAGTYIKFGDGDAVYLVAKDTVSAFLYGLTDLVSLTINSSATDSENNNPSSITLSGTNFPSTIKLEAYSGEKNSASYTIESPIKGYASAKESSLVEGAIRGLYAVSVKMVNPSSSQLSSLGLSTPYAQLNAVYPDTTVDVLCSKPNGNGDVNVMLKGGNIVYVMNTEKLPWAITSYEKLASEYALYPKMTSLSSVSINDGKKTYDFTLSSKDVTVTDNDGKENTTTTTTVQYNGNEIDVSYFSTLFQNISLTQVADRNSKSVSGKPILSITYNYSTDGSSDTVSFYSTGENRYVVAVNGTSIGHVHKSGINKAISQVATVASNKQIESVF